MSRVLLISFIVAGLFVPGNIKADIVQDWNTQLCIATQTVTSKHNPGIPTRAMAMMNGSIYDVFQAINRTHAPFKINTWAPGADLDAAVSQAAFRVISSIYPEVQANLDSTLAAKLGAIPDGAAKTAGINLGNQIAQHYIDLHSDDGWDLPDTYDPTPGVGRWSEDPLKAPQKGWGNFWANVRPWAMPSSDAFISTTPFTLGDLNSQRYTDAYNEVKEYGALNSAVRTADQTAIGLFWAYDRPGTGAPPVLFIENLIDIGTQIGNTPEQNARLFAMASVAQADAVIAAWDTKFDVDLWRPITGIRGGDTDGNPDTVGDPSWVYLGAPGDDPNSSADDFTPPFPAYTSGHATMGGAIYKTLELFYGTNNFDETDGILGNNPTFTLHSSEPGSGGSRNYAHFTQVGPLGPGLENSPEGENGMSRIYLGIHWRMDQEDGIALGNAVAQYVASHYFQAVPEPGTVVLMLLGAVAMAVPMRRKRSI